MMDTLFGKEMEDDVDRAVRELWRVPGWPQEIDRDRALVLELQKQFPGVDLIEEFQKFRVWLIERGSGKESTSRGRYKRVREWVRRAGGAGFAAPGAPQGLGKTSRARTGRTTARPAAAFGTESSQSLARW